MSSLVARIAWTMIVGRLLVFVIQGLPPVRNFKKPEYFAELFHCDFCLGSWVMFVMCVMFKTNITVDMVGIYIPVVSELITATILSFITHLTLLGAKMRWGNFDA